MSRREYRFSRLAEMQANAIWDYEHLHLGLKQADAVLDGLLNAIKQVADTARYPGYYMRLVPPKSVEQVTSQLIYYFLYEKYFVYLRDLSDGALGVICILEGRMDTPSWIKGNLIASVSDDEQLPVSCK